MSLAITIAPMLEADIAQVLVIDRAAFPQPWSENSYRYELRENDQAYFIVALDPHSRPTPNWLDKVLRRMPPRKVIGYAGFWLVVDEAHINTIAVHADWRRRGIGERMLRHLLTAAREQHATSATLEVRVSNEAAQALYRKYDFEVVGRRPRYYRDGEDALLMTVKWRGV
jgi:ribosomal-protein-alanine N-acetyltransferase